MTNFGSTKGFGFGLSTCGSNCFNGYVTDFTISLLPLTYVDSITYCEMEMFDNWGSKGDVYVNGNLLPNSYIGNIPSNDGSPDPTPRCKSLLIGQQVNSIVLHVWDITSLSEIYIDDLVVFGSTATALVEISNPLSQLYITPNPSSGYFLLSIANPVTNAFLEIYNMLGKKIFEKSIFNESKIGVTLSNISKGIYFVKVRDVEKWYVQKLIIQ